MESVPIPFGGMRSLDRENNLMADGYESVLVSMRFDYQDRPGRIPYVPTRIYLDNNIWDLLYRHKERVDIASEFPRPGYELWIVKEGEFELNAIRHVEKKAFIHETIKRADIRTDILFGFSDTNLALDENLPADMHRVGGPGVGRLAELLETQFMEAEYDRLYGPLPERKLKPKGSKLYAHEADIALGARSLRAVVLTLDDDGGALSSAKAQGGKVILLRDFDPADATLREFVLDELASLTQV